MKSESGPSQERFRVCEELVEETNNLFRPRINISHEELSAISKEPRALFLGGRSILDKFGIPRGTEKNPIFATDFLHVPRTYDYNCVQFVQTINNPKLYNLVAFNDKKGRIETRRLLFALAEGSDDYYAFDGQGQKITSDEELAIVRGWLDYLDEQYTKKVNDRADIRFQQIIDSLVSKDRPNPRPDSVSYRLISGDSGKTYYVDVAAPEVQPSISLPIACNVLMQRLQETEGLDEPSKPILSDVSIKVGKLYIGCDSSDIGEMEQLFQMATGYNSNIDIAQIAVESGISRIAPYN